MTIDLFRCVPLTTVLSRSACGARYERKIGATCTGCAVGRQHARGALPMEWPDGSTLTSAPITPATMASLKIHLAIIESHQPAPRRGWKWNGQTIREKAERDGLHPQVYRQRLLRGESPETALAPKLRQGGRFGQKAIEVDGETLTLRGLARLLGKHPHQVGRWLKRGLGVEAIREMCA